MTLENGNAVYFLLTDFTPVKELQYDLVKARKLGALAMQNQIRRDTKKAVNSLVRKMTGDKARLGYSFLTVYADYFDRLIFLTYFCLMSKKIVLWLYTR